MLSAHNIAVLNFLLHFNRRDELIIERAVTSHTSFPFCIFSFGHAITEVYSTALIKY
jgi:hypothetical protein